MEVVQLLGSQGPWKHQVHGEPEAMGRVDVVNLGFCLASGSSAPMGIEHEGGTAAWIMRTLVASSVQECWWPQTLVVWHYLSLVLACGSWCSKGHPSSSFSVAWCNRRSKGHPLWDLSLLINCWQQHVVREAIVMAPPPVCDSAVLPSLHGSLAFFQRHFTL